jgi:hypothetical protein
MSPKPTPPARPLLRGVLGVVLLAGPALLSGALPGVCRAEEGDGHHHCPPCYVHHMERPPKLKFKCDCPRPVCPPYCSEFYGYYPTCWRAWPAGWSNCPDRNPPWVAAAPELMQPVSPYASPAQPMPGADTPAGEMPAPSKEDKTAPKQPPLKDSRLPSGATPGRPRLGAQGPVPAEQWLQPTGSAVPLGATP